jgi:hypothetical protein
MATGGAVFSSTFQVCKKPDMRGLEICEQPARRGEALSDEFDGRVLYPNGVEIDLPYWIFKRFNKLCLLERDRETGKLPGRESFRGSFV